MTDEIVFVGITSLGEAYLEFDENRPPMTGGREDMRHYGELAAFSAGAAFARKEEAERMKLHTTGNMIEELSELEHASWAHWMKYIFTICPTYKDGSVRIPGPLVARWKRQANTPYAELTEEEKESDRREVRKTFPVLEKYFLPQIARDAKP